MPSQQQVAARANVSYMTVSRVVNNHPNVKKETRELVLNAIQALGYHPNASARALNAHKTSNIGLIFPPKENVYSRPFYVDLAIELEDQLHRRGYHLFLGMTRTGDQFRDPSLLLKERKVDGVILVAPRTGDMEVEKLVADGLPLVLLHGRCNATALFYSNDQMALGGFRAAYDNNLSIPEDISISGYDDTKYASFAIPALTTVRQPLSELASAAVELVLERIRGRPIRSVVLPPEIKIRSSCRRITLP